MDAHLLLLARPRALALAAARDPGGVAGFRRPASARRVAPRRVVLRPVAALGGGGGFAEVGELFGRVEAFLYTVADAAVSASPEVVQGGGGGTKEAAGDWLSGITNSMETVLKVSVTLDFVLISSWFQRLAVCARAFSIQCCAMLSPMNLSVLRM